MNDIYHWKLEREADVARGEEQIVKVKFCLVFSYVGFFKAQTKKKQNKKLPQSRSVSEMKRSG